MDRRSKPSQPTPPWRKKTPGGKSRPLSEAQKAAARARAASAGRPYPNLIDNMWAAGLPPGDAPVTP